MLKKLFLLKTSFHIFPGLSISEPGKVWSDWEAAGGRMGSHTKQSVLRVHFAHHGIETMSVNYGTFNKLLKS